MSQKHYHFPTGGLPAQDQILSGRSVFKNAYAVIPGTVLSDIVTSQLPFWSDARFWVLARPMSGFAETFSQYVCEVQPGGGSDRPETNTSAQSALFVVDGEVLVTIDGQAHTLGIGDFAYIPSASTWTLWNRSAEAARYHWIRKKFQPVEGLDKPDVIIGHDQQIDPTAMPDTDGKWATTRFIDPQDLRYDMNINVVTLEPGAMIPFMETHVMEHGLYVLEGRGIYKLNEDWVEVEAGDFMWLRAFCPQACYAVGNSKFRYLLYKDVNRHAALAF